MQKRRNLFLLWEKNKKDFNTFLVFREDNYQLMEKEIDS